MQEKTSAEQRFHFYSYLWTPAINEITCVHLALCLALGEEEVKKVKTVAFQEIRIALAAAKAHMHDKEQETKNNDIHGASK